MAYTTVTRTLPCFPSYADALTYFDSQKPIRGQTRVPMVTRRYWMQFNAAKDEVTGDIHMYEGHPGYEITRPPCFTYHPDNTVTITARESRPMWASTMTYMSVVIPGFQVFRRDRKTIMRLKSGEYLFNPSKPIRLRLVNGQAELHEETIIAPQVRKVIDRKALNKVRPKYKPFLNYFEVFWSLQRDDYGHINREFFSSEHERFRYGYANTTVEQRRILINEFACSSILENHYEACVLLCYERGYYGATKRDLSERIKWVMIQSNEGVLIEETVPLGIVKKDYYR